VKLLPSQRSTEPIGTIVGLLAVTARLPDAAAMRACNAMSATLTAIEYQPHRTTPERLRPARHVDRDGRPGSIRFNPSMRLIDSQSFLRTQ
jgi:hypothetical protein